MDERKSVLKTMMIIEVQWTFAARVLTDLLKDRKLSFTAA